MISEIGSEFSNYKDDGLNFVMPEKIKDYAFTFSGRTAIGVVLKNLPHIKKALLPSYCCDSMIEPFRESKIEVYFYNVNYQNILQIEVNIPQDVDLLLWCNYFGYKNNMPNLDYFINKGGIIVEDITHSLYSQQKYDSQSHFLVASLRKWGPLFCGGYCASTNTLLKYKPMQQPPIYFIDNRKLAMDLKEQYLINKSNSKKEKFMTLFNECNKWISKNYLNLLIDDESKKILFRSKNESIINKRISNARCLHEGLQNNVNIEMLFDINYIDCPLFVPIIIKNGKRDYYRKKLIENKIYCPIHWPHSNEKCESNLYELELSLICDQRYTENDMKKIISILCD